MKRNIFLLIFIFIGQSAIVLSQTPCNDSDAYNKAGAWRRQGVDNLASADDSFPKADYPKILAKAQKAVELIKQAIPKLVGAEGRIYRSIRGDSYFKNGALPFEISTSYKDYYCVPDSPSYPEIRGTIQVNNEKGLGVGIFFNSLGWITNRSVKDGLVTKENLDIYFLPKFGENFQNTAVLYPNVLKKNDEALVFSNSNASPFKILSREDYIAARKIEIQRELKKYNSETEKQSKEKDEAIAKIEASNIFTPEQKKQFRAAYEKSYSDSLKFSPQFVKTLIETDQEFDKLLASFSSEEKSMPAVIGNPTAIPPKGKIFITEQEGGRKLFTINEDVFTPNLPRDTIQLITIFFSSDEKHPVETKLLKEFKQNFNFQALRQMLGN